ncbi:MAG: recombinase family protein [Schwartzia succinivorans]|uniref:recombinase family protein n=1 Tax=Schwartzia succinivorans TaxID=55507 RepID=UPI0023579829|nr:recombinase family protein [Schwartzia succinivorans]MBE6097540.1 recombinase family protein [Schwartzia succinivorans]
MRNVTVIPASLNKFSDVPLATTKKRKVAAYARVSTDDEDQQTSYAAQCDYYERYIKSREDWEFVGLYSDEGISGCNTKKREGFRSMVQDALDGKIELIIAKSLSRFSRNTVDSLTTIRKLKENGVEVWFEKENIWTFQSRGEILLTILSSLSQEEARSISENVTWGIRKKMADGKFSVGYSRFLGYDKGEDGNLAINEEQAKTVRLIFGLFIEGLTPCAIAKELTKRGILTVTGRSKWNAATINGVLANEKYTGCARIQKTFTPDFLTKKAVKNTGQVPSYFVEQSHPAIIEPAVFEMVQTEIAQRKQVGGRYSGVSIFSGKIKCGECGGYFGAKVWHSTDKYRRVIYRCNNKYDGHKCQTPHVTEDEVKSAFVTAFNKLVTEREEVIANARLVQKTLCATEKLERKKSALAEELAVVVKMAEGCIAENARISQNQVEYQKRYNGLVARYDAAKRRFDEVTEAIAQRSAKAERLAGFVKMLEGRGETLADFDEGLWGSMVECVTVCKDGGMTVVFRDGTTIHK